MTATAALLEVRDDDRRRGARARRASTSASSASGCRTSRSTSPSGPSRPTSSWSTRRACSAPGRRGCRCRIGDPTIVTGATAVVSMFELFGFYLQRGLIDVGFLGAAQIDRFGNINTTVIGDYDAPDDAPAGLRRRVRDRDQRPRGVRDHAPEPAQLRRDASTSGRRPATSAAPSRPSGSGARAAGWAAARRSSSPTSASATSTRPARCGSTRSTRARRSRPSARRSPGTPRIAPDLADHAAADRRGAAPGPRGARPRGRLHELSRRARRPSALREVDEELERALVGDREDEAADVRGDDLEVGERERRGARDLDLAVGELRLGRDLDRLRHAVERQVADERQVGGRAGRGPRPGPRPAGSA